MLSPFIDRYRKRPPNPRIQAKLVAADHAPGLFELAGA